SLYFVRPSPPSPRSPYTTLFRSPAGRHAVTITGVEQRHDRLLHEVHEGLGVEAVLGVGVGRHVAVDGPSVGAVVSLGPPAVEDRDRKSTRLNSSHVKISYAVFCL